MSQQPKRDIKRDYLFEFLQLDKVDEGARMISEGFLKINSIWIKLKVPYDEAYQYNRFRMIQGYKKNWSFVHCILFRPSPMPKPKNYWLLESITISMITSTPTKNLPSCMIGSSTSNIGESNWKIKLLTNLV